jgi:predicted O-methyltransferase YrrM
MSLIRFLPKYAKGLLTCAYVFTVGVAKPSNRLFIYQLCRRFGWDVDEFPPKIPQVSSSQFLSSAAAVRLSQLEAAAGNVSLTELAVIAAICARRGPATIFEIGTFDGRTTLNLAENSPPGAKIYTLDLPASQIDATAHTLALGEDAFVRKAASGARFTSSAHAARITQLYGDSATFDFLPYRGGIDLIFVDASHAYEYVLADSRTALNLIRPGGFILWHDYGTGDWPGVNRALNELHRSEPRLRNLQWIEGTSLVVHAF